MIPSDPHAVHTGKLPERPHDTAALLRALGLRSPDPVRTAAVAEQLALLFTWLSGGARQIKVWRTGDSWRVNLWDDGENFNAHKLDPFDALAHAMTGALAFAEQEELRERLVSDREPTLSGERDVRQAEAG